MKPPKEVKKKKKKKKNNAPLENLTTKKMSTGPNLYYDESSSRIIQINFFQENPLRKSKKLNKKLHL